MGSYIARQPNGRLCRFSTIVDAVTHINLNPKAQQEYHEVLRQENEKHERQERTEMIERLGEKFKVTKA